MGVPPKARFIGENPNLEMDDVWGYPYDFGNAQVYTRFFS